jgi:preprotein translocase subunit SecD
VFNDAGADAFFEVTDRVSRQGDRLAIYLDNEELVAPGVSNGGISGGRAIIEGGSFTTERVRTIAIQLRSGALPVELELIQERNVDAVLGKDSLQKSLIAGGVGLVLVLIFMIAYYKVPGLVAAIALVAYTIMLLGIFKMIPVTLTLSGAAAVILSLGFAVDANVLIAERTKEELRSGRSLLAAITAGFDRAWPSIRDGNMSTIIVAIVLFWFGDRFSTSVMQGFALTLAIGVLLSMFTAFFASRLLLRLFATTGLGSNPSLFVPVRDQGDTSDSVAGGNS